MNPRKLLRGTHPLHPHFGAYACNSSLIALAIGLMTWRCQRSVNLVDNASIQASIPKLPNRPGMASQDQNMDPVMLRLNLAKLWLS